MCNDIKHAFQRIFDLDEDIRDGEGGFHDMAIVPFCLCNVKDKDLTIEIRKWLSSHFKPWNSRNVVDPLANFVNSKVCNACSGYCKNSLNSFFDNNNKYLDSRLRPTKLFLLSKFNMQG